MRSKASSSPPFFFTKRSSTGWGIGIIVFAVVGFFAVLTDTEHHYYGYASFWASVVGSGLLILFFFVSSYIKDRRGYSTKDLSNAGRTLGSVRTTQTWMKRWGFIIVLAVFLLQVSHLDPPAFLMGGVLTIFLLMGLGMLVDNLFGLGMFAWNSRRPEMRELYDKNRIKSQ
jgi:hypothetical protein